MRSVDYINEFRHRWWNTAYESERYRRWNETDRWYRELLSVLEPNPATEYIWFGPSQSMTEVDDVLYGSSPTPRAEPQDNDNIDFSFLEELL